MNPNHKIVIKGNLGLGDHLICNAIVRRYAKLWDEVVVPAKIRNVASVSDMYRDLSKVHVVPVLHDEEAHALIGMYKAMGYADLVLGVGAKEHFDSQNFDRSFYKHAGIDFEERWNGFKFPYDIPDFKPASYCFIHEDKERGMAIDHNRIKFDGDEFVTNKTISSPSIGGFIPYLIMAEEIHCIDSSFAILADSLPTTAKRKCVHRYARPGAEYPVYRNNWEILI